MSSPMTPACEGAWRSLTGVTRLSLVRVTLTDPTARVLYFAAQPTLHGGKHWDPVLKDCVVSCPGGWLTAEPAPATMRFTVLNAPLSPTGGKDMSQALAEHRYVGATVELFFSATHLDFDTDAYRRFVGVIETWDSSREKVEFKCHGRTDWNRPVAPAYITRGKYPQAPDESIGAPAGCIWYGDHRAMPLRTPFPNAYPVSQSVREFISGGDRVGPAVLVDTGRSGAAAGTPARVIVASHAVKQIGIADAVVGPFGTALFMKSPDGTLHVVDPEPANIFNDSTQGAGFKLPDSSGWAYANVFPNEIRIVTNYADDPRHILDPRNETRWATLDNTNAKRFLYARLPAKTNLGRITNAFAYVLYFTTSGYTGGTFYARNMVIGGTPASSHAMPASTTPTYDFISLGSAWGTGVLPNSPWQTSDMEVQVEHLGAGQLYVIQMGLVIEYEPTQEFIESERTVNRLVIRPTASESGSLGGRGPAWQGGIKRPPTHPYIRQDVLPGVTELRGTFFANVMGYADDGSGKYTGVAAALIERPPDVLYHALENYALETGKVEVGVGAFGSFTDARALLKTWHQKDMKLAAVIADSMDMATLLSWFAASSVSWVYLDEAADKWRFIVWRRGMTATYRRLYLNDVLDPAKGVAVESVPDSAVLSSLRVPYAWDDATRSFLAECTAGSTRSVAGHGYQNIRDQDLLVRLNENDRLDVRKAGSTATYQLTAGARGYSGLLTTLMGMNAFPFHSMLWSWGVGGYVHATTANKCHAWNASNVLVPVTFTAGTFATMEALAASAQVDLRAQTADSRWLVSYNRTTRKFTFSKTGGVNVALHFTPTGPITQVNAAATFGLKPQSYGSAASIVSDSETEEQRFLCTTAVPVDFAWELGPNGLKSGTGLKNCAELLGWDTVHDTGYSTGSTTLLAPCPKGDREQTLADAAVKYGVKRDATLEGRAILDSNTARETRNRLLDLQGSDPPPLVIRFPSGTMADVRRGDVFTTDAEWDAMGGYPKPGSDGSWNDKRFVVVELTQYAVPTTHTEVLAVAVQD